MGALLRLDRGAAQGLPITNKLLQTLCPTRDLADHPGLQHLAKSLEMGLIEQIKEGGIRGPALVLQPQRLVEGFPVPAGKTLQIAGAAAATEDPQQRHQQEEPLGVTHTSPEAAIWDGLEEADQIARSALIVCGAIGFGHGGEPFPPTEPHAVNTAKTHADRLLGGPDRRWEFVQIGKRSSRDITYL